MQIKNRLLRLHCVPAPGISAWVMSPVLRDHMTEDRASAVPTSVTEAVMSSSWDSRTAPSREVVKGDFWRGNTGQLNQQNDQSQPGEAGGRLSTFGSRDKSQPKAEIRSSAPGLQGFSHDPGISVTTGK